MKKFIQKLLNGRPMKKVAPAFVDTYGYQVNYYVDCYARSWMSVSRWGIFRIRPVPVKKEVEFIRHKTSDKKCYVCDGTGKVKSKPCKKCDATGIFKDNHYTLIAGDIAFSVDTGK